jgi:hypothetical protein
MTADGAATSPLVQDDVRFPGGRDEALSGQMRAHTGRVSRERRSFMNVYLTIVVVAVISDRTARPRRNEKAPWRLGLVSLGTPGTLDLAHRDRSSKI